MPIQKPIIDQRANARIADDRIRTYTYTELTAYRPTYTCTPVTQVHKL